MHPSKNFVRVSGMCIPPNGVLGNVFGGTNAKQYTPT
jgi:hypothetical protein